MRRFIHRTDEPSSVLHFHGLAAFGRQIGLSVVAVPAIGNLAEKKVAGILSGRSPDGWAVESQRSAHVIVNLITAKRLGLTVPDAVLASGTEVVC